MKHRSAKILATIGPASSSPDMLSLLVEVGVNAFRLNFSHGSHSDHERSIKFIRKIEKETGKVYLYKGDIDCFEKSLDAKIPGWKLAEHRWILKSK